ncbi:MAG: nucleotidyl transferase AbiEii/AbiGii toxin family protein [Bacteroidales bacterium]|nr:nucleotidyl transferase AbiEii/AbiGii toxin family protein [Bacteroidales bacterium]
MLRKESVDEKVFLLIQQLQRKDYLKSFILVGGTGLALQIGHRKSDDVDLFSPGDFDHYVILQELEKEYEFHLDYLERNTIKGSIGGIKVDILSHKYKLIKQPLETEGLCIASMQDIGAMKLNAISNDGTRVKDFIDLYYLLESFGVKEMLEFYEAKYQLRNSMHVLKSMNYFNEVDLADWPVLIRDKKLTWKDVRSLIDKKCKEYFLSLPGKE